MFKDTIGDFDLMLFNPYILATSSAKSSKMLMSIRKAGGLTKLCFAPLEIFVFPLWPTGNPTGGTKEKPNLCKMSKTVFLSNSKPIKLFNFSKSNFRIFSGRFFGYTSVIPSNSAPQISWSKTDALLIPMSASSGLKPWLNLKDASVLRPNFFEVL